MSFEYIKRQQRYFERQRELEAEKEAARIAKIEAEVRRQEEIAERKRYLLERQEEERLRQKHIQRKEKLAEQRWNNQFDSLLTQIEERAQKTNKLEEIRFIAQNREPSLQELDWDNWLSDPLNQELANLDLERAMEMFKRDNLMAKRRHGTRGKKKIPNYFLSFTGNDADGARADLVATQFTPHDPDGSGKSLAESGFTVSYWVRLDESYTDSFHIGWKGHGNNRFEFGLKNAAKPYISVGGNTFTNVTWKTMFTNSGNTDLVDDFIDGSDNLRIGEGHWYHIVVTYEGTDAPNNEMYRRIYFNGKQIRGYNEHSALSYFSDNDGDINWSRTSDTMAQGLSFGMRAVIASGTDSETGLRNTKYNNGNACALDEIAIYKEVKNNDWIANVYNKGTKYSHKTSGGTGLVAYWRFNEGNGTTVKDLSGYGYHGTLTNASYGTAIDNAINNLPPSGTPTFEFRDWEIK